MRLSIVIPAFNEELLIERTIGAVKDALIQIKKAGFSWELIVCDNHSTDRTADIARSCGARVVFESIRQISRVRNTGAGAARGDWLLFIDADSQPSPELIGEVVELLDAQDVVGCGSAVQVVDGTIFNKLRMERLNPLYRLFGISGGAFLLCRRSGFDALGGFSPGLYAYEEIDFAIRLKSWGRKRSMRFVVLHNHPVLTSGRRGDYSVRGLALLIMSNFAAVLLFLMHYLLPRRITSQMGKALLGYWYEARAEARHQNSAGE